MTNIREKIIDAFHETLEFRELKLRCELRDDAVLLETGLDSLGFAILVAKLDQELGYDPFILMEQPCYPRTFGEFVEIYVRFQDHAK